MCGRHRCSCRRPDSDGGNLESQLTAETGDDCSDTAMILGDYMRMGLMEAIGVMVANAGELLDFVNDKTKAAQAEARPLR